MDGLPADELPGYELLAVVLTASDGALGDCIDPPGDEHVLLSLWEKNSGESYTQISGNFSNSGLTVQNFEISQRGESLIGFIDECRGVFIYALSGAEYGFAWRAEI
jgi:hypothetical protein